MASRVAWEGEVLACGFIEMFISVVAEVYDLFIGLRQIYFLLKSNDVSTLT